MVPQSVYMTGTNFDQLQTIRFEDNGRPGISIARAYRKETSQLAHAGTQPKMSDAARKVTLRVNVSVQSLYITQNHILALSSGQDTLLGTPSSTSMTMRTTPSLSQSGGSLMKWPGLSSNSKR